MKNSEKNNSKVNNNNNNDVLSPESISIKAQLKAACVNMNAKETKEYIKSLAGYNLRLTGQKPTQHYTVFYGDVRVCNVEQVQGIKADGTARGCTSVAKVNFLDKMNSYFAACLEKLQLTDTEKREAEAAFEAAFDNLQKVQSVFDAANERTRAEAEAAAKAKRAEAAAKAKRAEAAAKAKRAEAAKERAQNKMNNKLKESSDNEKIAALAAVLDISFDEAKIIFEKKRAKKSA